MTMSIIIVKNGIAHATDADSGIPQPLTVDRLGLDGQSYRLTHAAEGKFLRFNATEIISEELSEANIRTELLGQTFDTQTGHNNSNALISGRLQMTAIALRKGIVISNFVLHIGGTPPSGVTNWWLALYDAALNLLAHTADVPVSGMSANTGYSAALTTPYTVPATARYYAGLMFAASTVPTIVGAGRNTAGFNTVNGIVQAGASTTGCTYPPPSTASAINVAANALWIGVK